MDELKKYYDRLRPSPALNAETLSLVRREQRLRNRRCAAFAVVLAALAIWCSRSGKKESAKK